MTGAIEILLIVLAVLILAAVIWRVSSRRNDWGASRGTKTDSVERAPRAGPAATATATAPAAPPATAIPVAPGLADRVRSLFSGGGTTEETWKGLEDALIRADVGPKASASIVGRVRDAYRPPADPAQVVAAEVARTFDGDSPWTPVMDSKPAIVMVVGVNGTGKTTTIGKLATLLGSEGRSVSLAASDTFRAAAGEQLEIWAQRSGAHLVSQERGADPGAVAYDAVRAAQARGSDVLIVDTAGRLHTKQPLMEELKKVRRVLEKAAGHVDEVLLVLDATTGQNGIAQARAFADAVDVTGVVLTKMDGTARGGIVLAVREELGVPVKLVGVGEGAGDLVPFDPQAFAARLVA
jgi:fused signal recognition particle receptor